MNTKIENINDCTRVINIEVTEPELEQKFDQVFADIRRIARVPGFRPGHAPRDLLETYYGKKAEEEVIKRSIPEYYLKAVKQEKLMPVAPPEIENVQFKEHTLYFSARVDVQPQVRLKGNYKRLRVKKKKIKIEQSQIDQTLERLRQSKAKQTEDDTLAQDLGFPTLQALKEAIEKNLHANAQMQVRVDMEQQIIEQLLKLASLDIPESLVDTQAQELFKQLKVHHILQGEKKEALEAKEKELRAEARTQAVRRVRLSFILDEIAQRENIQVNEEDLAKRIAEISQRSGKTIDEVRQYLDKENLLPSLKQELRDKKTMGFLLGAAKIEEE